MTMLDLRLILVLCCSIQLGHLHNYPFSKVCPPEFPHQYGMSICYSVGKEYLTFDEAQASCIAKGAKLAEPRRFYEGNFVNDLPYHFNKKTNTPDSYWFGITDTVVPGKWTYASDNRPFISYWRFDRSNPPHGNYCITFTSGDETRNFHSVPCEQKAKSVCQYDIPLKVCGIREGGELIPFNTSYTMPYVQIPCDYILASIVCGDYDVRVYGTSAPGKNKTTHYSPISARVVVQQAMTHETLVSAQVSRDAIAESTDGKNVWTVTAGAWSAEVREDFEPYRHAAVIKLSDVGQVDFSASSDKVENGLYVRCKAVRSSAEFPESLCGFTDGTTNWTQELQPWLKTESKIQIIMRVIFLQNAGQQLQCSDIARKVRSCPNERAAVIACSAVFIYEPLARCVEADKLWFDICLDAHCNNDADKCKQLKTKMADCGLNISSKPPRVMQSLMALLNTC